MSVCNSYAAQASSGNARFFVNVEQIVWGDVQHDADSRQHFNGREVIAALISSVFMLGHIAGARHRGGARVSSGSVLREPLCEFGDFHNRIHFCRVVVLGVDDMDT
jgi:hypothetical protein